MKTCAACSQELPKEKFSKKQWQLKQCRRCKECIAENRAVRLGASNEEPLSAGGAVAEEAPRHTDEDLFKQPPPRKECPICMLPLPLRGEHIRYQACCGKKLCIGCIDAVKLGDNQITCPFCRTPALASDGEYIERMKERAGGGDADAIRNLGCHYFHGEMGLRRNQGKAMRLYLRAGELGHAQAYCNLGVSYANGEGVRRNEMKAKYYWELAAMVGDVDARYNLGIFEKKSGNMDRAVKHWMIAAGAGHDKSLQQVRRCFLEGHSTKDRFERALRAHKEANDDMKSNQRDKAAAARG